MVKPGGKLVSEEVAASIVRFVAGGAELANAEVEPSLLSLICRELNNARIAQGRAEISADLLAGSRDTILSEFYERALADQPPGVRHVIEDDLLTESGYRENLAEERLVKLFAAAGAAPDTLAMLVNRRLLRIEERLDMRRVELTHDVLCGVVKASRDLRHEREARDEAERKLEAQRERERATRAALVRARKIAIVCAVLSVLALAGAVFGFVAMKRAQDAEPRRMRRGTWPSRRAARPRSSSAICSTISTSSSSRSAGSTSSPHCPSARSITTRRSRQSFAPPRPSATARSRSGATVRCCARRPSSTRATRRCPSPLHVLSKLRKAATSRRPTTVGLGFALMSQARVQDSLNKRAEARQLAQQAVEMLKPLMAGPAPSIPLRRAYGLALVYQGFSQLNGNEEEAAVKTLEEARETYRSIDGLKLSDLPSAVAYAEASAWEVAALQSLGRQSDARRVGEDAIRVAGQVLETRPGHMSALRARALTADGLSGAEVDDGHIHKSLELARQAALDWEAMLKLDPTNQIAWNNLASSRMGIAFNLWVLGRIRESEAEWRAALSVEKQATTAVRTALPLALSAGYLAMLEANSGNSQAAEAALADNRRLAGIATGNLPPDSSVRSSIHEFLTYYGYPSSGLGYGGYAPAFAAGRLCRLA